jgi:hypothetical protein
LQKQKTLQGTVRLEPANQCLGAGGMMVYVLPVIGLKSGA